MNAKALPSIPDPETIRLRNNLFMCASALILAGWVVLIDTGMVTDGRLNMAEYSSLLVKRCGCTIFGLLAMAFLWNVTPRKLRAAASWMAVLGVILLAAVFTPLGITVRGCRGWLNLGITVFQPIEFAKLALVWFLARVLARIGSLKQAPLTEFIGPAVIAAAMVLLVLAENEFSGMIFLAITILILASISGVSRTQLMWLLGTGAIACVGVIAIWPEKLLRFQSLFNPLKNLDTTGYQIGQSLWAIVTGGIIGHGPGHSVAMYSLPDHTTDFIFSIICEQYGVVGGALIIVLFAVFTWSAFRLALKQEDPFRLYLGAGIASMITIQAAINIGVATNVLPVTGLPLPFVSAGNSSLIMALAELGLLLNLSRTAASSAQQAMPVTSTTSTRRRFRTTVTQSATAGQSTFASSKSDWLHPSQIDMLYSEQRKRLAR